MRQARFRPSSQRFRRRSRVPSSARRAGPSFKGGGALPIRRLNPRERLMLKKMQRKMRWSLVGEPWARGVRLTPSLPLSLRSAASRFHYHCVATTGKNNSGKIIPAEIPEYFYFLEFPRSFF